MGWFSLHFDPENPYVDHSATPDSWTLDDKTHPDKFFFENWSYNESTRHFIGDLIFDKTNKSNTYYGAARYSYDLKFSEDFLEIDEGERREYDKDGVLERTFPHQNRDGLISYEYVIDHEVKSHVFDFQCATLREKDAISNIDNIIVNYRLPEADENLLFSSIRKAETLPIVRLQNETSF